MPALERRCDPTGHEIDHQRIAQCLTQASSPFRRSLQYRAQYPGSGSAAQRRYPRISRCLSRQVAPALSFTPHPERSQWAATREGRLRPTKQSPTPIALYSFPHSFPRRAWERFLRRSASEFRRAEKLLVPTETVGTRRVGRYNFGSSILCCFWYFPFLSAYEMRHSSSASKNKTWAMPSFAYILAGNGVVLEISRVTKPSHSGSKGV